MLIQTRQFSGERRKKSIRNINTNDAEVALDCEIVSDELRPIKSNLSTDIDVGNAKTIFNVDGEWLSWDTKVNVARSPADAEPVRIFWSGEGKPKQATLAEFNAGISYSAGVPKPALTPSAVPTPIASPVNPRDLFIVYTFVNAYGEEGDKSEPSTVYTASEGVLVAVTDIGDQSSNSALIAEHNIVKQRIYVYDTNADALRFLVELNITETSYNFLENAQLNEVFSTDDFGVPDPNLQGLHLMANGVMIGFNGRTVYATEPYLPNAWKHFFTVDYDVVALSSFDNNAVVLTTGLNTIATIFDPANISESVIADRAPCVSASSVVQGMGGVIFASPGGLYFISPAGGRMLTEEFFDQEDWDEVHPTTLDSVFVDGQYIGFHGSFEKEGKAIVFDTREGNAILRQLTQSSQASFVLPGTDELYVVSNGIIELFQGGEEYLDYFWRSKKYGDGSPFALAARRIISLDFISNPSDADIAGSELLYTEEVASTAALLTELDVTGLYIGYGGALNQDTIGGIDTYSVNGVTQPLQGDAPLAVGHEGVLPSVLGKTATTFRLYGNLELVHEEDVSSMEDGRVTYANRYRLWHYELEGKARISQLDIAGAMSDMHSGT